MYFEWVKYVVALLIVGGLAWSAYVYFWGGTRDGDPCVRDSDCPGEVCLGDARGSHCTRECGADRECDEGWRCLRAVERRGLHCIRPLD